jgi:hypothetical protein
MQEFTVRASINRPHFSHVLAFRTSLNWSRLRPTAAAARDASRHRYHLAAILSMNGLSPSQQQLNFSPRPLAPRPRACWRQVTYQQCQPGRQGEPAGPPACRGLPRHSVAAAAPALRQQLLRHHLPVLPSACGASAWWLYAPYR